MGSLQDAVRTVRERWLIVVAAALLGIVAAVVFTWIRPPEYTANVSFYVVAATDDRASSADAAYQGSLLAAQRVPSYVEFVTAPQVANAVADRLRMPDLAGELPDRLTASNASESTLIEVSIVAASPQEAVAIATALADALPAKIAEIEQPGVAPGLAPVTVRAVLPIDVPTSPSSTGLAFNALLGLFAGIVIGVSAAIVRDAFDDSVRTPADVSGAARTSSLARFTRSKEEGDDPLIGLLDPRSTNYEAARQLRTNIRLTRPAVLVATSPRRATGKTTVVCHLAAAMAAVGARTLVIEGNLRGPRLSRLLDIHASVGLTEVLSGEAPWPEAVHHRDVEGFDVLTSGSLPSNPSEILAGDAMATLIDEARGVYDIILIDSPALLPVTDAAVLAAAADGVLLVGRYRRTTRRDLAASVDTLTTASAEVIGTVLTVAPRDPGDDGVGYDISERFGSSGETVEVDPSETAPLGDDGSVVDAAGDQDDPRIPEARTAPRPSPRPRAAVETEDESGRSQVADDDTPTHSSDPAPDTTSTDTPDSGLPGSAIRLMRRRP